MKAIARALASLLVAVLALIGNTSAQSFSLSISGDVMRPMTITEKEFASFVHAKASAADHEGKMNEYEGVPLFAILARAGAPLGDSLKGKKMFEYIQAEAADGYKVIFALPEIDTSYNANTIIVADKKNGKPLDEKEGPLQIIVAGEKKHARWIRQLTTLRILKSAQ
jgi:DMSO/TMAO reductase YedYZ molybdopterin-dependent catalytic subunit